MLLALLTGNVSGTPIHFATDGHRLVLLFPHGHIRGRHVGKATRWAWAFALHPEARPGRALARKAA